MALEVFLIASSGRTTDSALFHAFPKQCFVGSWISGFRVRQASPAGMNVLIGGESGIPDLLVRDAMSATFPVSNTSAACSGEPYGKQLIAN